MAGEAWPPGPSPGPGAGGGARKPLLLGSLSSHRRGDPLAPVRGTTRILSVITTVAACVSRVHAVHRALSCIQHTARLDQICTLTPGEGPKPGHRTVQQLAQGHTAGTGAPGRAHSGVAPKSKLFAIPLAHPSFGTVIAEPLPFTERVLCPRHAPSLHLSIW